MENIRAPGMPDLSNAELGISVEDLLDLNILPGVELIAGKGGADRVIRAVTVMEAPDFLDWVKKDELLLTTGFAMSNDPTILDSIIDSLIEKKLAAMGIKLGRYISEIPEEMIRLANQKNFPLIKIPYNLSLSDLIMPISEAISERIARYLKLSEKMHDIMVKTTLETDGLFHLGSKLYELIGNPITIEVPTLKYCINIPEEVVPHGLSVLTSNNKCSHDNINRMERFQVNWNGNNIYTSIFPIVAGSERLGIIKVWELNPLSRLSVAVLERSISIAAYEIMKSYAMLAVESRYKNIIIDQLVSADTKSFDDILERANIFGWELHTPFCVAVIQPYEANDNKKIPVSNLLDRFSHSASLAIKKVSSRFIVAEKAGRIVVVLSVTKRMTDKGCRTIVETINQALTKDLYYCSYRIGIGRMYDQHNELHLSYEEACKALSLFDYQKTEDNVSYFNELGMWRLLGSIRDRKEVDKYIQDILGALIEQDKLYNTSFIETLEIFMAVNGSIKQTADFMGVHYNTISYRLDRVYKLFNLDIRDQHQRLSIELALKLRSYSS